MYARLTAVFVGIFLAILISTSSFPASGLSISTPRDNDSNAVIPGGVGSTADIQNEFNNRGGVRLIFGHFNINRQDINEIDSKAVEGHVTSDNRVIVNGETVATNAMTAGRQNMPGSTEITRNGTTFYVRPPSASFAYGSLPAYVVMKDGRFDYAIIASCGNPVKATPVSKPQPKKEVVTKEVPVTKTVVVEKQAPPPPPVVQREVIVKQAPPPPPPAQAPAKSLPQTGPESVLGLGASFAAASGIIHYLYRRRLV